MWVILIITFAVITELLIMISLNSSFKDMEKKEISSEINIYQAESTLVNGRIRGIVENTGNPNIQGKYIKIDIYSERDVKLGTKYIDLSNVKAGQKDSFEVFFKLENSKYYSAKIVDEMEAVDNKPFFEDKVFKQIFLLYPDPWPKARHAERRFTNKIKVIIPMIIGKITR